MTLNFAEMPAVSEICQYSYGISLIFHSIWRIMSL